MPATRPPRPARHRAAARAGGTLAVAVLLGATAGAASPTFPFLPPETGTPPVKDDEIEIPPLPPTPVPTAPAASPTPSPAATHTPRPAAPGASGPRLAPGPVLQPPQMGTGPALPAPLPTQTGLPGAILQPDLAPPVTPVTPVTGSASPAPAISPPAPQRSAPPPGLPGSGAGSAGVSPPAVAPAASPGGGDAAGSTLMVETAGDLVPASSRPVVTVAGLFVGAVAGAAFLARRSRRGDGDPSSPAAADDDF